MDKYNRRHSPRQSKDATIQVVVASDDPKGHRDRNDLIPLKMCNQSDEGLYIEIDRALMPGSNVRIKYRLPGRISSGGSPIYARWKGCLV